MAWEGTRTGDHCHCGEAGGGLAPSHPFTFFYFPQEQSQDGSNTASLTENGANTCLISRHAHLRVQIQQRQNARGKAGFGSYKDKCMA